MNSYLNQKSVSGCMLQLINNFCSLNHINCLSNRKYEIDDRISLDFWLKKIKKIALQYQHEGLGIEIAQHQDPKSIGLCAYILDASQNLREALELLTDYNRLWYDYTDKKVLIQQKTFSIIWEKASFYSTGFFIHETAISEELQAAMIYQMINAQFPSTIKTIEKINLAVPKPQNIKKYETYFNCSVKFDCSKTTLVFSKDILDIPFPNSDPILLEILLRYAKFSFDKLNDNNTYIELVNQCIIKGIENQNTQLEFIANALGLAPRVLQSKLKNNGVTFQLLLEEIRFNKAKDYLINTNLSINEISHLLGYKEQSSFNRSFKIWSGCSPLQWRKKYNSLSDNKSNKTAPT